MLRSVKKSVVRLASQIKGVRPAAEDQTGGRAECDLDVVDPVHPSSAASSDEKRQSGGHSLEGDLKHLGLRHDDGRHSSLILRWSLIGRIQPIRASSCAENRLRPARIDVISEEGRRRWKLRGSLKKKMWW